MLFSQVTEVLETLNLLNRSVGVVNWLQGVYLQGLEPLQASSDDSAFEAFLVLLGRARSLWWANLGELDLPKDRLERLVDTIVASVVLRSAITRGCGAQAPRSSEWTKKCETPTLRWNVSHSDKCAGTGSC